PPLHERTTHASPHRSRGPYWPIPVVGTPCRRRADQGTHYHRRPRTRLEGDDSVLEGPAHEGGDEGGRYRVAGQGPDRRQPREVRRVPAQLQGHQEGRAGYRLVGGEQERVRRRGQGWQGARRLPP